MRTIGVSILCGAIGIGLLRVFYAAVRLEWPSNYVTTTRRFGLVVNRTVRRYLLFILAPVYLVSLLMSTLAARERGLAWLVALAIGIGHGLQNHGSPALIIIRHNPRQIWTPDVLLQLGLILASLMAAIAGGFGPGPFGFVVPPIDEFFKALWTSAAVALIGIMVLNTTERRTRPGDLFDTAERSAEVDLVAYAVQRAKETSTDPDVSIHGWGVARGVEDGCGRHAV